MSDGPWSFGIDSLTVFDLAWPAAADTLRPNATAPGLTVPLQSAQGGDYLRIRGYRQAAMALSEILKKGDRVDEALAYPFVYCWRHHVELQIKKFIEDSVALHGDPLPEDVHKTHSIGALWNIAEEYIKKSFPNDSSADTTVPGKIIGQLAQIDPDGMVLRYARTASGQPTLKKAVWVELEPFHTAMLNLSAYFNGAIEGTSALSDCQPY